GAAERVRAFGCDPAVVARAWRASCAEPALGAELETAAPEELAGLARAAREGEADVDTILLFDVHEGLAPDEADALLGRAAALLRPGGRLFVRTVDGARTIRSRLSRLGRAAVRGRRPARPARELAAVLAEAGLETEIVRAGSALGARVLVVGSAGRLPVALLR
ncbi:MAG: hypothetical protein IT373_03835, partial [Polyangiaceae bacterium]|nr:hypothetical protein [Polyangiaceae bacterium]